MFSWLLPWIRSVLCVLPSHVENLNPVCEQHQRKTHRKDKWQPPSRNRIVFLCVSLSFFVISHTHSDTRTHSTVLIKAARRVRLYRCVAACSKPAPCGGHRPGSWCAKPLVLHHLNHSIWASLSPPFLTVSFSPTRFTTSPHSDCLLCTRLHVSVFS